MHAAGVAQSETIFNKMIQIPAYGDDVVIIGRSLLCVKEVFLKLDDAECKVGLGLNEGKTKIKVSVERVVYNTYSIMWFEAKPWFYCQ